MKHIISLLSEFPDFKFQFDSKTEKEFRKDYIEKSLVVIRTGFLLAIVLYSVFGFLDIWIVPYTKHIVWTIRFAIVIPIVVITIIMSFYNFFKRYNQLLISISLVIGGLGIVVMIAFSKPKEMGYNYYYSGLILVLMYIYTFMRLRFWNSLICALIVTAGYEYVAIFIQHLTFGGMDTQQMLVFINNNFFFISANIIGMFASYNIEKMYRLDFLQKQKIKDENIQIVQYNQILNQNNEEIITQRNEIESQRDLVTKQKEHIEEIHEEVTSSIRYAQRIQEAVLPYDEQLNDILKQYFIIYKPCYIVSGDFFWATRLKHWVLFCVADCTGHGVPGGFLSMLGISFLNEIVRKNEITNAADILNHLREYIILSLKQKGVIEDQKDGLDISFCAINTETLMLQFAGAYNSCYIVRKQQFPVSVCNEMSTTTTTYHIASTAPVNCQLIELKGDKMPIAIHQHMEPFTLIELQLLKDDCIYLFSDGFADQFGGPKRKKYLVHNLRQTIKLINQFEFTEQKHEIEKTFQNWKGNYNQVDDVTVLGIKI